MQYIKLFMSGIILAVLALAVHLEYVQFKEMDLMLAKLMYVDSELTGDLTKFVAEGKLRGVTVNTSKLTMLLSKTGTKKEPYIIGTCQAANTKPLVIIDKKFYTKSSMPEREELVFHELGHCLLGRIHCNVKDKGGISVSIMEPILMSVNKFSKNRKEMLDELFKPNPFCPGTSKPINELNN